MNKVNDDMISELNRLCLITLSDFSSLAWIDKADNSFRWKYASGNTNERFQNMVLRPNQGWIGSVIRVGRPLVFDLSTPNYQTERNQNPIFLAENLLSAAAVPVHGLQQIEGILLIAARSIRKYTEREIQLLQHAAEQCLFLINKGQFFESLE